MSASEMEDVAARTIEVNMGGGEIVEFDLNTFATDHDAVEMIVDIFESGNVKVELWTTCALECVSIGKLDDAELIINKGLAAKRASGQTESLIPLHLLLAHLRLAKARGAPKVILENAQFDKLPPTTLPKSVYYEQAAEQINKAQAVQSQTGAAIDIVGYLSRAVHYLSTGNSDQALKFFEAVLTREPNNLVALMGKGRILYTQRDPLSALRLFQRILQLNPQSLPNPRIGIGLCFWVLNSKEKAKAAWKRSLSLYPSSWQASLLLGLERLNYGKDPRHLDRSKAFELGLKLVADSFKGSGMKSSAAACAISTSFALENEDYAKASKLAERAMQYADTRGHFVNGQIALARVYHVRNQIPEAKKLFDEAAKTSPSLIAEVCQGQLQIENGDLLEALHTFEGIHKRFPSEPEVSAIYASLLSHSHPGRDAEQLISDKVLSRSLFDSLQRLIDAPSSSNKSSRDVGEDPEMFVEMAKIWHGESLERAVKAYRSAARLSEGKPSAQLTNNLAALAQLDGDLGTAEGMYLEALETLEEEEGGEGGGKAKEAMKTTLLYNLGRALEGQGKTAEAKEAYGKVLAIHPEYSDAKVRLASMALSLNHLDVANSYLKEALTSNPSNLELRAFYLYFLVQCSPNNTSSLRTAIDFAYSTLRDARNDVYSLCAAGWLTYYTAREAKPTSAQQQSEPQMKAFLQERAKNYSRSAGYFETALILDPECSYAAQGFAIAIAEDVLTLPGMVGHGGDEARTRVSNARQALAVFQRVRESLTEGSVYVNMGHCYFATDEFERAIESYETALQRFYDGVHAPTLLYLARMWYTKANKEGNFSAMRFALRYAQKAMHIQPHDKAILFNVAMIQQKAAEMLVALPVEKRSLSELKIAIEQATHAQKIFQALAADRGRGLPYSTETANQRFKYGTSIIRRAPDQLERQAKYESQAAATVEVARQRRENEKRKLAELEAERMLEIRRQAESLAEERKKAREQVASWVIVDVDWKDESKKASSSSNRNASKKRKHKKDRRAEGDEEMDSGAEGEAMMSGAEGGGGGSGGEERAPKPKRAKKPKVAKVKKHLDPDGEDAEGEEGGEEGEEGKSKSASGGAKRGKRVISKETIESSDDDE
ncbi:hypothetical protein BDY24DRAFT_357824 [Mrakia frigida]|uniref:Ctr9p n=1 Tax=Mrakia frigida TaxID=29902 RepID=UPI003FCC1CE6